MPKKAESKSIGKKRVLIVDDNEDVRILVSTWLKDVHDVSAAVDGSDCINKLKAGEEFDVILLDVMMPGPKPPELIKKIVKYLPDVKIIYLTAVEMFSPTEEQQRKGFLPVLSEVVKGYLVKPVTKDQLIEKIREVFETEDLLKQKS